MFKIIEHPTKLWRPYTAPEWKCDLKRESNKSRTELGQAEGRGANIEPEGTKDRLGAHLESADKRSAGRHGKERNQQNKSADGRSHQAGKAYRAAGRRSIQLHSSLRIRHAKAAEMSGLDGCGHQNCGQTHDRDAIQAGR
jgi:hypothetical protein